MVQCDDATTKCNWKTAKHSTEKSVKSSKSSTHISKILVSMCEKNQQWKKNIFQKLSRDWGDAGIKELFESEKRTFES